MSTVARKSKMRNGRSALISFLTLCMLPLLIGCGGGVQPLMPSRDQVTPVVIQFGSAWEEASLADVGMEAGPIDQLIDLLQTQEHDYHSLIVVKDGKLVVEEYWAGQDADLSAYEFGLADPMAFDRDTPHFQASVTKSITSILVGIAIDEGFLQGVDEKMFAFFPEYADLSTGGKEKLTLAHMLTMGTGIPWDESYPYTDVRNDLNRMWHDTDPIRVVLEKPVVAAPTTRFLYNSGTTNLLGEIVRRGTGMSVVEFAEDNLFGPLGISDYEWVGFEHDPDMALASSGLYLRPRDMAKIGQLYLQEGMWNGEQIVSREWVQSSVKRWVSIPPSARGSDHASGYGYQWWLEEYDGGQIEAYSARGHGLQFIVVLPDLNMVVVFTGGAWSTSPFQAPIRYNQIIEDYILPAVKEL
jgi:CubicO group peptidase (beta-lactamase class C family)